MAPQADLTLTLVCKRAKHAVAWVTALTLLRRAYAEGWGLPPSQLGVLKLAFKAASGSSGKESLSLAQQQDFFQCLARMAYSPQSPDDWAVLGLAPRPFLHL